MSGEDNFKKHSGPNHSGLARHSPYPNSRLAPAIDLVDKAAEIQRADALLRTVTDNKLEVIVAQIRALQAQADAILDKAKDDAELHRAKCQFKKQPGKVYHLYAKESGERHFSMLSPEDWGGSPPHRYEGSYRLEADMSWTPADAIGDKESELALVRRLMK